MKKFWFTAGVGGILIVGGMAFLASLAPDNSTPTYIDASGQEVPTEPGTTVINHNYPPGATPPDQSLSLSAESAAGEYDVRLSLANEAALASLQQGVTCTAADLLIEAHQESRATGVSVERLLLKKLDLVQGQGSKGWELVERVSFRPEDRQKFFDPVTDLAAITTALTLARNGEPIPTCEVIPETAFGPQGALVEAGGSYLRLKRQVPTLEPQTETADAGDTEVDIDAGETE